MKKKVTSKTKVLKVASVAHIKAALKTRTYREAAMLLATQGFVTPRGHKPTKAYINYIVSQKINA